MKPDTTKEFTNIDISISDCSKQILLTVYKSDSNNKTVYHMEYSLNKVHNYSLDELHDLRSSLINVINEIDSALE